MNREKKMTEEKKKYTGYGYHGGGRKAKGTEPKTCTMSINKGKRIIITSDRQPNELKGLEDRLVTRFSKGLTVKINEPDVDTCVEILKEKIKENAAKEGVTISEYCIKKILS